MATTAEGSEVPIDELGRPIVIWSTKMKGGKNKQFDFIVEFTTTQCPYCYEPAPIHEKWCDPYMRKQSYDEMITEALNQFTAMNGSLVGVA